VELEPSEIQALIAKDPAGWASRAKALHDAGAEVIRAVDARDADKVLELGERVEGSCEGCHRQYWYPNEVIPEVPKE
jgi:hypothetical protein